MELTEGSVPSVRVARVLCALGGCLVAVLLYQLARRIVFPWDFYIWSESPFMTNMLKLSAGEWPFDAQSEANSFVYSPGLEYICYAFLHPFGLELDVRACRAVVVLMGFGACACVTGAVSCIYAAFDARGQAPLLLRAFAFEASALLLFRNFTADVCHPDNLFILHAMASLYLLLRCASPSSASPSNDAPSNDAPSSDARAYRLALFTVAFASLGALAKQNATFGGIGAALALVWLQRKHWSLQRRVGLVVLAALVTASVLATLRSNEYSRLFLFDVLMKHPVYRERVMEILRDVTAHPHRLLLWLSAGVGLFRFRFIGSPSARIQALLVCWAVVGIEVLPAFGGYLKANGMWNNFTIVDVWLAVIAIPSAWAMLVDHPELEKRSPNTRAIAAGVLALLVILLVPLKLPPSPGHYAFGTALDNAIKSDLSRGKRVLLPHGTMPFIRAGVLAPQLDRSNSVLELRTAGFDISATKARIAQGYYARIYMFQTDWYGREIQQLIERNYHQVGVIPGDLSPTSVDDFLSGYGDYMRAPVRVLDVNPPGEARAPKPG
jgi:hypothetical protein